MDEIDVVAEEKILKGYENDIGQMEADRLAIEIENLAVLYFITEKAFQNSRRNKSEDPPILSLNAVMKAKEMAISRFRNLLGISRESGNHLRIKLEEYKKIFEYNLDQEWIKCSVPGTVFSVASRPDGISEDKKFYFETAFGAYLHLSGATREEFLIVFDYEHSGHMYEFRRSEFNHNARIEFMPSKYLSKGVTSYSKTERPELDKDEKDIKDAIKWIIDNYAVLSYEGPRTDINGMHFESLMAAHRIWPEDNKFVQYEEPLQNFVLLSMARRGKKLVEFTLHDFEYIQVLDKVPLYPRNRLLARVLKGDKYF